VPGVAGVLHDGGHRPLQSGWRRAPEEERGLVIFVGLEKALEILPPTSESFLSSHDMPIFNYICRPGCPGNIFFDRLL
jgi:hypothetical protein